MSANDVAERLERMTRDLREINERRARGDTNGWWLVAAFALLTAAVGLWRFS